MKKKLFSLSCICFLITMNAQSQTTFPENVGIGSNPVPDYNFSRVLQITGARPTLSLNPTTSGGMATIQFGAASKSTEQFHFNYYSGAAARLGLYTYQIPLNGGFTSKEVLTILGNGNVGIGTSTPTNLLSLYAAQSPAINMSGYGAGGLNGAITIAVASESGAYSSIATPGDAVIASRCGGSEDLILSAANNFNGAIRFTTGPTCNPGDDVERMTILNNGNIGIGTTVPGSFKLAVEGKIGAREIQILSEGVAWPDYVFADDYKLKPLSEIEKYVKIHRHLPGMPSQEQVKENGGVEVGAMQTRLLEQVEELVLHLIELKKENESIKAQLEDLKKKQ